MFLVYPPVARSSEPPIGIARLAGFLEANGHPSLCLDLNQEGQEFLLGLGLEGEDRWTRRALKNRSRNREALRSLSTYSSPDRYGRAVADLNRALQAAGRPHGAEISLADYAERDRSPLRMTDLLSAGRDFAASPFFPLFSARLGECLRGENSPVVGISVEFLSQALPAFALAGFVRAGFPGARVVLGGGLITSWVRLGAFGEKENFGGLVDRLFAGRGEDALGAWLDLPTPWNQASPLFRDFSGLDYFSPQVILPYNFSNGCPWKRCTFCPEKAENLPYQGRQAAAALGELRLLAQSNSPGLFHFSDSEIAPLYLRALADSPPGPPWYGFARFSDILADPGFCARLAASGCKVLQLGLESGDQAVLDAIGKGTRMEVIERVLSCLADAGIETYVYVLFGTPAENRDAALRTRDFVAANASRIGFLNAAIFNMPVTSPEAGLHASRPFYEGDLSLYCDFEHPSGWSRGAVRRFLAEDFESEPAIRNIIRRNPPTFTSSHAPFFGGAACQGSTGAISSRKESGRIR